MHATQEDPKDQGSPNNCFDHSSKSHMQDMPTHLDHMAMHSELGDEENPGKNGAVPLDTMEELKENLKSFTDSMHQKGSQVIMWMNSLEGLAHERATKPLGCINPCFSFSVYSFDSSYVFFNQVHRRREGHACRFGGFLREIGRSRSPHRHETAHGRRVAFLFSMFVF